MPAAQYGPHTEAAIEANQRYAAERAAHDPRKRDRAIRVTAVGLIAGTVTPADILAQAEAVAKSAPAPSQKKIEALRALLAPSTSDGGARS